MILVESDVEGDWDSRVDWASIADRSARAAIAQSRYAGLVDSDAFAELSVKFTTDEVVRELNAAYRQKEKPTNVLSFPMLEAEQLSPLADEHGGEILLGDVVLADGICATEATGRGIAVQDHAAHLVAHGVLHLLGYDHETGPEDAEAMEQAERAALASIGISDPYHTEVRS